MSNLIENNRLIDVIRLLNVDLVPLWKYVSSRGLNKQPLLRNHGRRNNELLCTIRLENDLMRSSLVLISINIIQSYGRFTRRT